MRRGLVSDDLYVRVLRARSQVREAYEERLTLARLARTAHLSPFHFLRVYAAAFGKSPGQDLTAVRLAGARKLLAGGATVTEACLAVGFSSLGSFSASFTRAFGMTPRAFQRTVRTVAQVPAALVPIYVPFCYAERFA